VQRTCRTLNRMGAIAVGERAPDVPGVGFEDGPVGLFFYKVTCPTCQMAAPTMGAFERAFPGRVIGVGQDPSAELDSFADRYAMGIPSIEDAPAYPISASYRIESVPTLILVGEGGRVLESVGAWDRDGFNRVAATLADLTDGEPVVVSTPTDGLPAFKPG
jgi:thiol-disulfide isomerase/thioredoxin